MSQRIGYFRWSGDNATDELARSFLRQEGCLIIFEDKHDSLQLQQPELENCLKQLSLGDTLVLPKLSCLRYSVVQLVELTEDLCRRNVTVEVLNPKVAFDSSNAGKAMCLALSLIAEAAQDLQREQLNLGCTVARARGRSGGRKPKLSAAQVIEIRQAMNDPRISVSALAQKYGISRTTLYKVAPVDKCA